MFVADNELTRKFYKRWNENWTYSCFEKGQSQDQPALLATDKEFGYIISDLPGIYNAQVAMSLKYFADAAIVHWWHMSFIVLQLADIQRCEDGERSHGRHQRTHNALQAEFRVANNASR